MQIRRQDKGNVMKHKQNLEKKHEAQFRNVTHTHKFQPPHTAVRAHRVCNRPSAVVADVIAALQNDADQTSR
jgi:hypothetical protein